MADNIGKGAGKSGLAAGAMIAGAVCLLALPSAVLAFTAKFEPKANTAQAEDALQALAKVEAPSGLARPLPVRSLAEGQIFPFTPAGTPNRPDRSVTVAVRVDPETAQAISARQSGPLAAKGESGAELRIAPTAFNLGVSRGYKNFSQGLVSTEKKGVSEIPDLGRFSIAPDKSGDDSRFSPRIVMDETQSAGRAPRTFAGDSDDLVDVGGAYRVTKNLDVTAGVRYSQERERLVSPLTDGKQDSQAVYVGTQFRF